MSFFAREASVMIAAGSHDEASVTLADKSVADPHNFIEARFERSTTSLTSSSVIFGKSAA